MLYFIYMPSLESIFDFVFTDHALTEMARREISKEDVKSVLEKPDQTEMVSGGRAVYQARRGMGNPPKIYLLLSLLISITSHHI